jgi:hypothetical protein
VAAFQDPHQRSSNSAVKCIFQNNRRRLQGAQNEAEHPCVCRGGDAIKKIINRRRLIFKPNVVNAGAERLRDARIYYLD